MSFDADIKAIKKLVSAICGGDNEVFITFRGYSAGITKPWMIKCGSRELTHEQHDVGAQELLAQLKKELRDKIASTERQADDYRKVLGGMEN